MTSTCSRVSSSRKPVISLVSRPSIFAEYTKPDFLSPSILNVTVLFVGVCFVQTSITCLIQPASWGKTWEHSLLLASLPLADCRKPEPLPAIKPWPTTPPCYRVPSRRQTYPRPHAGSKRPSLATIHPHLGK